LANGSPVIAKRILGEALATPVDGGARFVDGRPLLGPTKTIRGVVVSLLVTAFAAPLIGVQFKIGLLAATTAMAGDLLSSFLKRRFCFAPSSKATGLDQIPEALFPLLACRSVLSLTVIDIVAGCVIFFVGEAVLSHLFFRLRLRDRPY
jgi:CDP-2,3-bis-(O-geranylgeranyl)-sn-glycerol synthase